MSDPTTIGQLRWRVGLAQRQLEPTGTYNIAEVVEPIAWVYADVRSVSLQSFIGSEQIDFAITHRIIFRWQPFAALNSFNVILRDLSLPDNSQRREIYQIRRVEEYQGLHWWITADCELQRATG